MWIEVENGVWQQRQYIEDGPVIREKEDGFHLTEIPFGGGEEEFIGVYDTFPEANEQAEKLT